MFRLLFLILALPFVLGLSDLFPSVEERVVASLNDSFGIEGKTDRQSQDAIVAAEQALARLEAPNFAFRIRADGLVDALRAGLTESGLNDPVVGIDQQRIAISGKFAEVSIEGSPISLSGKVAGYADVVTLPDRLLVVPRIDWLNLTRISGGSDRALEFLLPAVNRLVDLFLGKINAELRDEHTLEYSLFPQNAEQPPTLLVARNVPSQSLQPLELSLGGWSLLLDQAGVHGLLRFDYPPRDPGTVTTEGNGESLLPEAERVVRFDALRTTFLAKRDSAIGAPAEDEAFWFRFAEGYSQRLLGTAWSLDELERTEEENKRNSLVSQTAALNRIEARLRDHASQVPPTRPLIAAFVTKAVIDELAAPSLEALADEGILEPRISFGEQEMLIETAFKRTFPATTTSDIEVSGQARGVVTVVIPEVKKAEDADKAQESVKTPRALSVDLVPTLSHLAIDDVRVVAKTKGARADWEAFDLRTLVPSINILLQDFLATANAKIARDHKVRIDIPTPTIPVPDWTAAISDAALSISTGEVPLSVELLLAELATLITPEGISLVAVTLPEKEEEEGEAGDESQNGENVESDAGSALTSEDKVSFSVFREHFASVLAPLLEEAATPNTTWIAVDRGIVAGLLQQVMPSTLAATYDLAAMPPAKIDERLGVDPDQFDCTPTDDCSQPACKRKTDDRECAQPACSRKVDNRECGQAACERKKDTRNCRRCISYDLGFIKDKKCFNEPTCEAAKAAQNQIYLRELDLCNGERDAKKAACEVAKKTQNQIYQGELDLCNAGRATKKLACEAAKETQNQIYLRELDACNTERAAAKLFCEGEKTITKGLCEGGKLVSHLAEDLGQLTGEVRVTGEVSLELLGIAVEPDLSVINTEAIVGGAADVRADIEFVPHNAGHLAICTTTWSTELTPTVKIVEQAGLLPISLSWQALSGDRGAIRLSAPGGSVPVSMNPSPLNELFTDLKDIAECPVLATARTFAKTFQDQLGDDVKSFFSGSFEVDRPAIGFDVEIPDIPVSLPGSVALLLNPSLTANALLATGSR